jgi:hypothetical protein
MWVLIPTSSTIVAYRCRLSPQRATSGYPVTTDLEKKMKKINISNKLLFALIFLNLLCSYVVSKNIEWDNNSDVHYIIFRMLV